jgi:hypothetical protein
MRTKTSKDEVVQKLSRGLKPLPPIKISLDFFRFHLINILSLPSILGSIKDRQYKLFSSLKNFIEQYAAVGNALNCSDRRR